MEIIRNLTRRKLRNTLTISGIVIGVLALVTMGAMAEKFNALIDGGVAYFGGNIQVSAASSTAFSGGTVLPLTTVNKIEKGHAEAGTVPADHVAVHTAAAPTALVC